MSDTPSPRPVQLNMSHLKIQRNGPCPCASGKKYKHCCLLVKDPVSLEAALAQHRLGNLPLAQSFYRRLLLDQPEHPDALHMLGTIAYHQGDLPQAEQLIGHALRLTPSAATHGNFGLVRQAQGRSDDAIGHFQQALALDPNDIAALSNMGQALQSQGRLGEAIAHYLQALALDPANAIAYCNLGAALHDQGNLQEAMECYQQAIAHSPRYAMAHNNLGNLLRQFARTDEAIVHLRAAVAFDPNYAMGYNNLANLLRDQGQPEEAMVLYREALARDPGLAEVYSNLLLTMQTLPGIGAPELFAAHQEFAARYEAPLKPFWPKHTNNRDPDRRLRIGYVSGDFRAHPVVHFVEPIISGHTRARVELFCYYNHPQEDAVSRRIASYPEHWLVCHGMSDAQLAQRIMDDGIDILIDLSGHTAFNRMLVFARKPAPVQFTWVGYQSTTGLTAMDYRFTDAMLDPPGLTERFHTETLLRLPSAAPFRPHPDSPPVNQLPALSKGFVTFACLNQLTKISNQALALWARILVAVPHSRLMLGNVNDASTERRLRDEFEQHGVSRERLLFQPRLPFLDYLALHQEIDLGLDSFPYNGGTTTCIALSMGVPVVTLAGETPVARAGMSIMEGMRLDGFVAHSEDAYVARALAVVADLPALNELRQQLRDRVTPAVVAPEDQPIRAFGSALRTAWQTWCATPAAD